MLTQGRVPIVEDHLEELVREGQAAGRLRFVVGASEAVEGAEFVFLCVPTPQGDDGSADLSFVEAVAEEIGPKLLPGTIIVNKSTVPVGSTLVVERVLGRHDSPWSPIPSSSGRGPRWPTACTRSASWSVPTTRRRRPRWATSSPAPTPRC